MAKQFKAFEIYLNKRNKVIIPKGSSNLDKSYLATILKNIEGYGYTLSHKAIDRLSTLNKDESNDIYRELIRVLERNVGSREYMKPMYPNFPKEVMDTSYIELYINAIIHYLTDGVIKPYSKELPRELCIEKTSLRIIDLGSEEDFNSIFTNMLLSKGSISDSDKEILEWFVENKDVLNLVPNEIPMKENLVYITKLLINKGFNIENILPLFKTATDVLRLAVAMSDGDISLSSDSDFKHFKRAERRFLLELLENINFQEEDFTRYPQKWTRLGEILHPGEYKKYVKVNNVFDKIRNNKKIDTFIKRVEKAIADKDLDTVLKLLSNRPGIFARMLDRVIREFSSENERNDILKAFSKVSDNVSSNLLLQVSEHFKRRYIKRDMDVRVFYPKGKISKSKSIPNTLELLPEDLCKYIINQCEKSLIKIYKDRTPLGKVFIDEKMNNYIVPMSQRTASKSIRTLARGSKIPIKDNATTIRAFVYWKEPKGVRTDLDLSAIIYSENFKELGHISYTRLRNSILNCCHSGDIVSAPNGASEYIDIDLNTVLNYGGRYVLFNVLSFNSVPFIELPESFCGFMERESVQSGEIYEPKTVVNKMDITSDSKIVSTILVDVKAREVVWVDTCLKSVRNYNNIEGNNASLKEIGKSILNIEKPNMGYLAYLNAKARGTIVNDIKEADTIFTVEKEFDNVITPYDVEIIMSDLI